MYNRLQELKMLHIRYTCCRHPNENTRTRPELSPINPGVDSRCGRIQIASDLKAGTDIRLMLAQLNTLFLSAKFSMWPTELYEINVGVFLL